MKSKMRILVLTVIILMMACSSVTIPITPFQPISLATEEGRIAFVSARDGNAEIYVMDANGSQQTRLTSNLTGTNDDFPAWSPDGQEIAFVSNRDGNDEIYVMNTDGSHQTRLTEDKAGDYYPEWSPDGQRLAFVSDRNGEYEVCLMNADGSGQTCLADAKVGTVFASLMMYGSSPTSIEIDELGLSWSPDGQRIVFASHLNGNASISVMKTDGNAQSVLTSESGDSAPDWSPDGSKITFVSSRVGAAKIYVMNADGREQISLTRRDDDSSSRSPSWSADGGRIVFQANRDGNYQIYVMNADGSGQTRLTNNLAQDWNPDWARVSLLAVAAASTDDTGSGAIGGMVSVPGGMFQMGCDPQHNEQDIDCYRFYYGRSLHQVYLDAYQIDKYEVTNAS